MNSIVLAEKFCANTTNTPLDLATLKLLYKRATYGPSLNIEKLWFDGSVTLNRREHIRKFLHALAKIQPVNDIKSLKAAFEL